MSAHQMPLEIQNEVKQLPGNDKCVDCSAKTPQWASISYGTLFCLECSGQHRGLGVHISFVRSVTLDSWSEKQIEAMRLGGNKKLVDWFKEKGVDVRGMSIKEKYNTPAAELYRLRLAAIRDGKEPPTEIPPKPLNVAPPLPRQLDEYSSEQQKNSAQGVGLSQFHDPIPPQFEEISKAAAESFGAFTGAVSSWTSAAAEKIKEVKLAETLQDTVEGLKHTGERIQDTISDPNAVAKVQQTAAEGWATVSSTATSFWGMATTTFGEVIQQAQQAVGEVMPPSTMMDSSSSSTSSPSPTSPLPAPARAPTSSPSAASLTQEPTVDDTEWLRVQTETLRIKPSSQGQGGGNGNGGGGPKPSTSPAVSATTDDSEKDFFKEFGM